MMSKALKDQAVVNFPPGHTLVREGDKASYVYAIMEGECKLTKNFDSSNSLMSTKTSTSNMEISKSEEGGFGSGVQPLVLDARGEARPKQRRNQTRVVLQSGFVAKLETKGLARLGPKSLVGDIPCLLNGVQPASVVSTTNVKALQFSCTDYKDKISQYSDLKKAFTHMCKIRAAFVEQRWQVSNGNAREADVVDMNEMFDRQTEVIKVTWRNERLTRLRMIKEIEKRLQEEEWDDPEDSTVWTEDSDGDEASSVADTEYSAAMTFGTVGTVGTAESGREFSVGTSSPGFTVRRKKMTRREKVSRRGNEPSTNVA